MSLPATLIRAAMGLRKTAHHHWAEAREYRVLGRIDRAISHERDAARCIATARFNLAWARRRIEWPLPAIIEQRDAA